jgi:hypothetical protein
VEVVTSGLFHDGALKQLALVAGWGEMSLFVFRIVLYAVAAIAAGLAAARFAW